MSKARPSKHELSQIYGTRHKREEMSKDTSNHIRTKLNQIIQKAKNIPEDKFNVWDKASIEQAIQIQSEVEIQELRLEIARLMELAGIQYEGQKFNFWKQYHARQKAKRDE